MNNPVDNNNSRASGASFVSFWHFHEKFLLKLFELINHIFFNALSIFWPHLAAYDMRHIRWKPYILVGSAGSVRAALAGEPAVGNWSCGAARERLQRISLFSCPGSTSRPPPVIFGASGDRADRTGSAGSMWASLSRQWPSAGWSGRRGPWWFFFVWFLNWAEMETVTVL